MDLSPPKMRFQMIRVMIICIEKIRVMNSFGLIVVMPIFRFPICHIKRRENAMC